MNTNATAVESLVQALVNQAVNGNGMDAFEQFYAENLEKTDLDGNPVQGKDANRAVGEALLGKITTFHAFESRGFVVSGNRAFVHWFLDFDHADNGRVTLNEVAVQEWENGQIVRERFFA